MIFSFRYLGTCDDASAADRTSSILQKLKADAEKRKRKKELSSSINKDQSFSENSLFVEKSVNHENKSKTIKKLHCFKLEDTRKKQKRSRTEDSEYDLNTSPKKVQRKLKDGKRKKKEHEGGFQGSADDTAADDEDNSLLSTSMETEGQTVFSDVESGVESQDSGNDSEDSDIRSVSPDATGTHKPGPDEVEGYTVLGDFKPKQLEKVNIASNLQTKSVDLDRSRCAM